MSLTNPEIQWVVHQYIGVEGGYLGDFSYRTHNEFYPLVCELDIDPSEMQGTTRQRFIQILQSRPPSDQARILRGVLQRFPQGSSQRRTEESSGRLSHLAERLEGIAVTTPTHASSLSNETIQRALRDAEILIQSQGATSGLDRIHTALHAYLISLCRAHGAQITGTPDMRSLFQMLREYEPLANNVGLRSEDVLKALRGCAQVLDALGPARNEGSLAHPNDDLLEPAEAMLFINMAKSLMSYLNLRFAQT